MVNIQAFIASVQNLTGDVTINELVHFCRKWFDENSDKLDFVEADNLFEKSKNMLNARENNDGKKTTSHESYGCLNTSVGSSAGKQPLKQISIDEEEYQKLVLYKEHFLKLLEKEGEDEMNCSPQQLSEKLTLFTEEYFKLLGNENNSEPEISIAEANLKKWKGLEKEYIQLKETRLLDKPNYILGADGARILIKKDANFYEKIYALILEKFQFTLVTEDNSKKCRVEKMKYELSEMFLDIAEEFLEEGDGGLTSEMAWTAFALEIILFFKEFGILFKGHKSLQTLARYAAEWYYKRFPERFPRTFFRGLMDHINRCLNNYYNGYGTTQEVYNSLIYVQDFCKYFNQIDKKAFKKELDRFLPIDNQPKKFRHIFLKKKSQKMDGDGPDTFIYEASDYREL